MDNVYKCNGNKSCSVHDNCYTNGGDCSLTRDKDYSISNKLVLETIKDPIIGFKMCYTKHGFKPDSVAIVILEIPSGACIISPKGLKCRTNKAIVKDIFSPITNHTLDRAYSTFNGSFSYYIGDSFNIKNFDFDPLRECSTGIHFYTNIEPVLDLIQYFI